MLFTRQQTHSDVVPGEDAKGTWKCPDARPSPCVSHLAAPRATASSAQSAAGRSRSAAPALRGPAGRGESVRPVRAGSGVFHPPPGRAGWRFLFRTSLHFSSGFATACLVSGAWRETANNLQTYSHMRFACKRCDSDYHALSDTARCCVANM